MLLRLALTSAASLSLLLLAACSDSDSGDTTTPVAGRETDQALPGGTPALGDSGELVLDHLKTQFSDSSWVGDLEEARVSNFAATLTLDRNGQSDADAFDEACTAAAGYFAAHEELGVKDVVVKDANGKDVMRTEGGKPQCESVAS